MPRMLIEVDEAQDLEALRSLLETRGCRVLQTRIGAEPDGDPTPSRGTESATRDRRSSFRSTMTN